MKKQETYFIIVLFIHIIVCLTYLYIYVFIAYSLLIKIQVIITQDTEYADNETQKSVLMHSRNNIFTSDPSSGSRHMHVNSPTWNKLEKFTQTLSRCNSMKLPGYGVIIVEGDNVVYQRTYGKSDIVRNVNFSNETIFSIGSCTKAFTAFLLGQLHDEGLIRFDDPISNYIHIDFIDDIVTKSATISDLLTHHLCLSRNDYLWVINRTHTPEQFLRILKNMPFAYDFRYYFLYNNWGFTIASLIIEAVTNLSWHQLVKTKIFNPLHLTSSFTRTRDVLNSHQHLYAYPNGLSLDNGVPTTIPIYPTDVNTVLDSMIAPAGSILLSINDIGKYLKAVLNKSIPNVFPSTFDMITTKKQRFIAHSNETNPSFPFGMSINGFTFAWINGNYKGHRFFAHNGGTLGHSTFFIIFPDEELSIAFVTNQLAISNPTNLIIASYIFDLIKGLTTNYSINNICDHVSVLPLAPNNYKNMSTMVINAALYVGTYYNPLYDHIHVHIDPGNKDEVILEIGVLQGKLRSQNGHDFLWFTETTFEAEQFLVSFQIFGQGQAYSLSMQFEKKVPPYIFERRK